MIANILAVTFLLKHSISELELDCFSTSSTSSSSSKNFIFRVQVRVRQKRSSSSSSSRPWLPLLDLSWNIILLFGLHI